MSQPTAFARRSHFFASAGTPRSWFGHLLLAIALMLAAVPAWAVTNYIINDGSTDGGDADKNDCVCADSQMPAKCTLRAAIQQASQCATVGETYTFTFTVPTVNIINGDLDQITAPVTITGPVTINGQGNAFKHGCLDFSDAQTTPHDRGSDGSQVIGVNIQNCSGDGITANGHNLLFSGNTLHDNVGAGISLSSSRTYGTFVDTAGLQSIFDNFPPIPVSGTDVNNFAQQLATVVQATLGPSTITGNFIFSNGGDGVLLFSENLGAVTVSANFIGTDPTGNLPVGNAGAGVRLITSTFLNVIGPDNVIGDNADGIAVDTGKVYLPNFVLGNRIGVPSATLGNHVGNKGSGITTDTSPDDSQLNTNPSGMALLIAAENTISDNQGAPNSNDPDLLTTDGAGVYITGSSSGVKVIGNTIGMAAINGSPVQSKAYGNAADGVLVTSKGNTIQNNTIAGNKRHGVVVQTNTADGNSIVGNTIGLYPAFPNDKTLGNGFDGVHIDSANATAVGGPSQSDGNTIVANGRNGVALRGSGWGNLVQNNTIFGNAVGNPAALPNQLPAGAGLGIDLNDNLNSPDATHPDCPSCANLSLNTPYICTGGGSDPAACTGASAPSSTNGQSTIIWTLTAHGPADFRADFFKIGTTDDNTATGITPLGSQTFSTDAGANLTGAGCSNNRCTATVAADASGAHVLMTVTDITQLTDVGSIVDDWKKGLVCFLGLTDCPVNDTSEFSNVADVPLSNNADLSNLTISVGTLTPAFDSATTAYTDSVSNATTSVTVTPTVAESHATIKVNTVTVASGNASGSINLAVGNGNTIDVVVTAQDGTTQKTYQVTVARAGSSNADLSGLTISAGTLTPAFASGTTAYNDSVSNATTSVTVTPTASDSNATITVEGNAVASGNASGTINLAVGNGNVINVVVTAQDGVTQKTYAITVTRAGSSDATLSNLTISVGTLTPAFASGTTLYSDDVSNATTSVTVTPTANEPNATIKVNTVTVASGNASGAIALGAGGSSTPVSVVVTAQDGVTQKTYTINVNRAGALSNNAALSNLTISVGTLTPAFAGNTFAYDDNVVTATTSVTLTPTAADATATITVNGNATASGATSAPITLGAAGTSTPVNVVVTAQDGVTQLSYVVTVNRAGALSNNDALNSLSISVGTLTPAFTSGNLAYADDVPTGTTSVTVTPTAADSNATITVNGTAVASGATSGAITLGAPGSATPVNVQVTAEDGVTQQTYVVTVNRAGAASNNASLSNLTISSGMLMPGFAGNTLIYTDAVTNATSSVTVTPTAADAGATIKVNTVGVASGATSGALALNVGDNTIDVVVTAADLVTTQNYKITVNRAGALSNNALLSNLTISAGTLTPAFAINTVGYTDSVSNATASVTVTPTAADPGAMIKVNTVTVASGAASAPITLAVGDTPVNVVVTAADGTTTQTYTITVNRAGALSNDAALSGLTISAGTLTPAFAAGTLIYSDAVANATASVTVTPTAADAGATIKVNTVSVASGNASGPIPLNPGDNAVSVVVTAADTTTTRTYTITVNRAGALSNDASLSGLTISAGTLTPVFSGNVVGYTDSVANAVPSLTVTPTATSASATIKVNTVSVTSGSASGALALAVGPNPVDVVVTAQDGTTTRDYLIVVTRAAAAAPTQVSGSSFTGTGTITATISGGGAGCGFGSYAFVGAPVAAPAGVNFPDGLFQFTATGCTGTVTITAVFPTAFAAGEQYWKYGQTPGPMAAHWYALGAGNNVSLAGNTATFTITDGGLGDDDLAANNSITDAGGPAPPVQGGGNGNVTPLPMLSMPMLALLVALFALFGVATRGGRRPLGRGRRQVD